MFYDLIRGVLNASHASLTWSSESDYPVRAALKETSEVCTWTAELFNGRPATPEEFIDQQLAGIFYQESPPLNLNDYGEDTLPIGQLMCLKGLFMMQPERQFVFKRPTDEPRVFDLYLLCKLPYYYAGIKTKVVET